MTDFEAANFDDELLSAYLDDELTPGERARVEAHLAADPRARQLLDELRAVSRAMKDVPPATLGIDLRESVLRRAERAMLLPSERTPASGLNEMVRKLPFGRSKRAWAWAGMALAAGLLLMFFNKEPERNQGLPAVVAKRERSSPLEVRSAPEPPAREEVGELATVQPSAPASPPAPLAAAASDRAGDDEVDEVGEVSVGGGFGGSAAVVGQSMADAPISDDLLVVHVNVNPAALHNRSFDAVLARNDIEVEQPAVGESDKNKLENALQQPQNVDVLLLEAAPEQIMSTLAELDADHANYLGIAVDDRLAASQRAQSAERSDYDFKQHNRGSVPVQQQLEVAPNRNYYYQTDQGPIEIERKVRREIELQQQLSGDERSSGLAQGRALRMEPQAAGGKDAAFQTLGKEQVAGSVASPPLSSASAPGESTLSDAVGGVKLGIARRASQKLATKAEMLQVLFVLTAGEEPAAAKPAESPAKEGLKNEE